jgi:nicotinate-nucleotide adenylyltransferase
MRIGLLGGSFNPAHFGHVEISKLAIKKLKLDQVWWVPTAQNPLKDKSIYQSYEQRVEKALEVTKNFRKIRLAKLDEIYSEKLVRRLKNQYKNNNFFWLMGADNLEKFHHWGNFKKLIHLIPLVVFSRETFLKRARKTKIFSIIKKHNHQKTLPKIMIFRNKNIDISSTKIRLSQ